MTQTGKTFCLAYLSTSTISFTDQDLTELLTRSRANNSKLGISGMLLCKDGNFLQVLEGEEAKVIALYQKIARDPRHRECKTLFQDHSSERNFPEWSMGFKNLRSLDLIGTPGFSRFLDSSLTARDLGRDVSRVQELLMLFRENKIKA